MEETNIRFEDLPEAVQWIASTSSAFKRYGLTIS